MGIAAAVESAIDNQLGQYVADTVADVCAALVPVATTSITIYFIVMGWAIMRGDAQDPFHTFLWKTFRIALVTGIALSAGAYNNYILEGVNGTVGAIVQAVSDQPTVGALLDNMAQPYKDLGNAFYESQSGDFLPNFSILIAAGMVSVAQSVLFVIGFGMYMLAKVALSLLLVVGPVFIFLSLFDSTRKFTESWIGAVANYVLLTGLVAACIGMLTKLASQYAQRILNQYPDINPTTEATSLLIISVALCVVLWNINTLASAIAGGASLEGMGRALGRRGGQMLQNSKESRDQRRSERREAREQARAEKEAAQQNNQITQVGSNSNIGGGSSNPLNQPIYRRQTLDRLRKSA